MESAIRLDDMGWSEHVTRDDHKTIPPRVSGLRLRIMEGVAFAVLISDATCQAHLTQQTIQESNKDIAYWHTAITMREQLIGQVK
jgi:hypothetical protein